AGRGCRKNDGQTSRGGGSSKRTRSPNGPAIPPDGGQRLFQFGRRITMSRAKWNESGRVWEEDHGLLDAEQVSKCKRADVAEPLRSPVPTRMISIGEYMPAPQTDQQKRVEARLEELADEASKKLGVSRRQFLAGSGGMAATLLHGPKSTAEEASFQ